MPIGSLLVCVSRGQYLRLAERRADNLQTDRQQVARKTAGNRDGGGTEAVEGRGIARRPSIALVDGGLDRRRSVALRRQHDHVYLIEDAPNIAAALADPLECFDIVDRG